MITYYAVPRGHLTEIIAEHESGESASTWWFTPKTISPEFLLRLTGILGDDLMWALREQQGFLADLSDEEWRTEYLADADDS